MAKRKVGMEPTSEPIVEGIELGYEDGLKALEERKVESSDLKIVLSQNISGLADVLGESFAALVHVASTRIKNMVAAGIDAETAATREYTAFCGFMVGHYAEMFDKAAKDLGINVSEPGIVVKALSELRTASEAEVKKGADAHAFTSIWGGASAVALYDRTGRMIEPLAGNWFTSVFKLITRQALTTKAVVMEVTPSLYKLSNTISSVLVAKVRESFEVNATAAQAYVSNKFDGRKLVDAIRELLPSFFDEVIKGEPVE